MIHRADGLCSWMCWNETECLVDCEYKCMGKYKLVCISIAFVCIRGSGTGRNRRSKSGFVTLKAQKVLQTPSISQHHLK